jgi:hypothetical protein
MDDHDYRQRFKSIFQLYLSDQRARVIPGTDADSSVFPYNGQCQSEMAETLARIKRREAEAALRQRLMSALTGLENAAVEARIALNKWDEFKASGEVGSSPSLPSFPDSPVSAVDEQPSGADIGSQEGGAVSCSAPPSEAAEWGRDTGLFPMRAETRDAAIRAAHRNTVMHVPV